MNTTITRNEISRVCNVNRCSTGCGRRATRLVSFNGQYYEPRCGYHTRGNEVTEVRFMSELEN